DAVRLPVAGRVAELQPQVEELDLTDAELAVPSVHDAFSRPAPSLRGRRFDAGKQAVMFAAAVRARPATAQAAARLGVVKGLPGVRPELVSAFRAALIRNLPRRTHATHSRWTYCRRLPVQSSRGRRDRIIAIWDETGGPRRTGHFHEPD